MCDVDTAISIICEYAKKYIVDPSNDWPKDEFSKRSYQQWAAYEICHRIMDHPFDDPINIIEEFMFETGMYAYCYENEIQSFIFQSAVETAEELLLLFV